MTVGTDHSIGGIRPSRMNAVERIRAVIQAGVLCPELTLIPRQGATDYEIRHEESLVGRPLCADHREILRHWNGIGLEVIRLFGCGESTDEIGRLSAFQIDSCLGEDDRIVVGSDAAGLSTYKVVTKECSR